MARSPGHQQHPDHKVIEQHPDYRVTVTFNGEKIADSSAVVEVREDDHPVRYYFPRAEVKTSALQRTDHTTRCPFKGLAHYYSIKVGDRTSENAVWTYEDPYDEHMALKEGLAFYEDRVDRLEVDRSK